jgi:serine/threonine protein kinase
LERDPELRPSAPQLLELPFVNHRRKTQTLLDLHMITDDSFHESSCSSGEKEEMKEGVTNKPAPVKIFNRKKEQLQTIVSRKKRRPSAR